MLSKTSTQGNSGTSEAALYNFLKSKHLSKDLQMRMGSNNNDTRDFS